jgi:hypothetical protein
VQCPIVEGEDDGGATVVEVTEVEVVSVAGGSIEACAVRILHPRAGGENNTGLEIGVPEVVVVTVGPDGDVCVVGVSVLEVEVVCTGCDVADAA